MSTNRVNGRQLTIMVVAGCLAFVLAPMGVFAAAKESRVSIVDGDHPQRAAAVTPDGEQLVQVEPAPSGTPFFARLSQSTRPSVVVPAGKTLVITMLSGTALISNDSDPSLALNLSDGTSGASYPLPLSFLDRASTANDYYGETRAVSIQAQSGDTLTINGAGVLKTGAGGADSFSCLLTITGYLVPNG